MIRERTVVSNRRSVVSEEEKQPTARRKVTERSQFSRALTFGTLRLTTNQGGIEPTERTQFAAGGVGRVNHGEGQRAKEWCL